MLCSDGELPAGDGWAFEVKWDGIRATVAAAPGELRIRSRHGRDITAHYPELAGLDKVAGGRPVLLDGELICLDDQGRPSFARMQRRLGRPGLRQARDCPVQLVVFDVLWLDGEDVFRRPYRRRRELLEELQVAKAGPVAVPAVQHADGAEFFGVVRDFRLEGLVAKRLDAAYQPGKRSRAWRKVKAWDYSDLLVCAVEGGRGARRQRLGALHLARPVEGALRYAGSVGTGFSRPVEAQLTRLLAPLACEQSLLADWRAPRSSICVQPTVAVRVRHLGYSAAGLVRQASFDSIT